MREILFRGKRTDNGEWVEGYLIHDGNSNTHVPYIGYLTWDGCKVDEVIPETVSEFTSLYDKNGKKIFEGDILKIARVTDGIGTYYLPSLKFPVNVVVKWDMCAWMWETLCEDKRYIGFPDAWCHFECEIIGNIHDTPELLKGGAE